MSHCAFLPSARDGVCDDALDVSFARAFFQIETRGSDATDQPAKERASVDRCTGWASNAERRNGQPGTLTGAHANGGREQFSFRHKNRPKHLEYLLFYSTIDDSQMELDICQVQLMVGCINKSRAQRVGAKPGRIQAGLLANTSATTPRTVWAVSAGSAMRRDGWSSGATIVPDTVAGYCRCWHR
jgi:hypothetical protein